MSFGNSGGGDYSLVGNAIDNYVNDTNTYDAVSNAINNYVNGNEDYGAIGNAINGYVNSDTGSGFNIGNNSTNWGSIINTLGRLGSGVLGGLADYQSSANQQAYIPYTQWLGNGLAKFSAINNRDNKQQQQNNAYGNALMLSSLFGHGFGRNNDTIDPLPGSKSVIWD